MTAIAPFKGLRFNQDAVSNLSRIISPPYDKIPHPLRRELWQRDEHNVVKLILPPPSDKEIDVVTQSTAGEAGDWYGQAADRYRAWRAEKILCQDERPGLYVYRQTFEYRDCQWKRIALFAELRLDDRSGPHAHERTFDGPKADRLRLLRAMKANPSPIFLLADGTRDEWDNVFVQADTHLAEFRDFDGQEHELFSISNPNVLSMVIEYVNQRTLVIADGHHRYETALNYCREMREATGKDPQREPWGGVFVAIVPSRSPGLLVLPTHRVVLELPEGWMDRLLEKAKPYCEIEPLDGLTGESIRDRLVLDDSNHSIAVVSRDRSALVSLKPDIDVPALRQVAEPIRTLHVSFLHHLLFEACLGLNLDTLHESTRYIRGEEEAFSMVRSGEAAGAFLLSGISPETVFRVSLENVRMPQKSTDFYPKIPTGLVLRSVDDSTL